MQHTVLIVDDSPTAGPELRSVLEHEGYTVLTALRAEEALDLIQTKKVDLIITEALLPTMDGFELVRQVRDSAGTPNIPIIVLTVRSAPEDYAASFEAGANEHFLKPIEPPKVVAAVRGLIARFESGRMETPTRGSAAMPSRTDRGRIITVFSPKGGVGTTSIAVNVAIAIKQAAPSSRVALIDLSLEEGHDALLLDIVPTSTIVEWAREDLSQATPYLLNQYFVQHKSGLGLLAAPPSPEQAEIVKPAVVRLTLELAPQAFDYIVVDTASNFSENTLIALELAQTILMPVTADMASMKSATNATRIFEAVNIKQDRVQVLQNEIVQHAGLTRDHMETGIGKKVYPIPYAGAGLIDSINQGQPFVSSQPHTPTARALIELARTLCVPEIDEVPEAKQATGSFMERLQRLRRAT